MPYFGNHSKERLLTCHPLIQEVLNEAIELYDFAVLCGYRGEKEQNECFARGASDCIFPKSRHNKMPSTAVDCAPFPISWAKNMEYRFKEMADVILMVAENKKIPLEWGGIVIKLKNGSMDNPHFQLKKGFDKGV